MLAGPTGPGPYSSSTPADLARQAGLQMQAAGGGDGGGGGGSGEPLWSWSLPGSGSGAGSASAWGSFLGLWLPLPGRPVFLEPLSLLLPQPSTSQQQQQAGLLVTGLSRSAEGSINSSLTLLSAATALRLAVCREPEDMIMIVFRSPHCSRGTPSRLAATGAQLS